VADSAQADSVRAAGKVPIIVGHPIEAPTKTILPLDDATIDRVAGGYATLSKDQTLTMGNVDATLHAGEPLYPWQQYALTMINQVIGQRPIYFASSGNAASALGVNDYLVRQGLAFKLHNGPLPDSADPGIIHMQQSPYRAVTGDFVDVPRTAVLVDSVFVHHTGIPDAWGHWPDQSTIGIPNYYLWAYLALAQAAIQNQNEQKARYYQERAQAWMTLGSTPR
jgi:hypothetical protein